MAKVVVLLGKSASGKSTIEKVLQSRGYKRIISTTTRPIREHEQEGVDYHYVTEEKFSEMLKNDELLEHTSYRDWHYAIHKNEIDIKSDDIYICVLEPHGTKQIMKTLGKDMVIPIYIHTTDKELLLRSLCREDSPDINEIWRRFYSDKELFANVDDFVVQKIFNSNIETSANMVEEVIRSIR